MFGDQFQYNRYEHSFKHESYIMFDTNLCRLCLVKVIGAERVVYKTRFSNFE